MHFCTCDFYEQERDILKFNNGLNIDSPQQFLWSIFQDYLFFVIYICSILFHVCLISIVVYIIWDVDVLCLSLTYLLQPNCVQALPVLLHNLLLVYNNIKHYTHTGTCIPLPPPKEGGWGLTETTETYALKYPTKCSIREQRTSPILSSYFKVSFLWKL